MRKRIFCWATALCALCVTVSCADPDVGERQVNVIPAPVELVRGEGLFPIGPRTEIGYNNEALRGAAARLSEEIERVSCMKLAYASCKESNCIIFMELLKPEEFADLPATYGNSQK